MQLLLEVHVKIVFILGLFVRKIWVRMLQPRRFQHPLEKRSEEYFTCFSVTCWSCWFPSVYCWLV